MPSSVPLGHKLIAVVVACATAGGLYAFLRYRQAELAFAASLSFDSAVAQQLDPGIARAPHPAVVLGQSILSDTVVAGLVPQADLSASPAAQAIGEFRSRLELSQPAAGLLSVRYRDSDPGQAIANANAVANALAAWEPASTTASPPAAKAQPAPAPSIQQAAAPQPQAAPPSAHTHAAESAAAAGPALAAGLKELQAQLSAADQHTGPESSFHSEHDRQRYLESQVRAIQQNLDSLRGKFAHSGSASDAEDRLDAVQHALALFWPSAAGINTAGTSAAQLAYERDQLTRDIAVVEQQQHAAQSAEAAHSASATLPTPPAAPPAAQPQPAPPADVSSPPAPAPIRNPLHLDRLAGLPAPVAWWPPVLAGCICGLLYWGLAFAGHRSRREPDDELDQPEETSTPASVYRLFDNEARAPADSREEWIETYPVETSSYKRAHFTFDLDSDSESDPGSDSEPDSDSVSESDPDRRTDQSPDQRSDQPPAPGPVQASTEDTVPDKPPSTAAAPIETEVAETASGADTVGHLPTPEQEGKVVHKKAETAPEAGPVVSPPVLEEQERVFHEEAETVYDADSVAPIPVPEEQERGFREKAETTPDADPVAPVRAPEGEGKVFHERAEAVSDADAIALLRAAEEQDKVSQQKIIERASSWEEEMRKSLSQTTFARMLDPQVNAKDQKFHAEEAGSKGPARDVGQPPSEPDRLAG